MSQNSIRSMASRQRLVHFLVALTAAVAYQQAAASGFNEKEYLSFLQRAMRGEITIRGGVGISLVQGNKRAYKVGAGSGTIAITLDSAPTAGNLLILTISTNGTGPPSISSIAQSNVTWTFQVGKNSTGNSRAEIWVGIVVSSASTSLTITLSGDAGNGVVANVCEWTGIPYATLDQTQVNNASSSTASTGTTPATTVAAELVIGCTNGYNVSMSAPTNGFTLLDGTNAEGKANNGFLYKIVAATGTQQTQVTLSSGGNWSACIATFYAGTAPPFSYPITMDGVSLPHVLSVKVTEKSNVESLMLSAGAVPARTYEGRVGRAYTISGWTKLLSDLSTIMGYANGITHSLGFNTETITVLVVSVPEPRKAVDGIIVYPYTLALLEYGT